MVMVILLMKLKYTGRVEFLRYEVPIDVFGNGYETFVNIESTYDKWKGS